MVLKLFVSLLTALVSYGLVIAMSNDSESKGLEKGSVTFTILYDNNAADHRLRTAWGFSCLIECETNTVLFDTGGDGRTLLENMKILNKDPKAIQTIILSHSHGDHTGGLERLLRETLSAKLYVPGSFPEAFDRAAKAYGATVVRVNAPLEICSGFRSTGEMGNGIKEQSLLVSSPKGIILITGCAHPGIIEIIRKAKSIAREDIYMVIGGWHLSSAGEKEIEGILGEFRRMGIQKVAPCHCTGDKAMAMFRREYGGNFIKAGVGSILRF